MKKMFSMKVKEIAVVLFALFLAFGCGTEAPYGTVITINPSEYTLSASAEYTLVQFFDILVTRSDRGVVMPLNGVEIEIRYLFAPPLPDWGGSGLNDFIFILDENLERQDSPFITETDEQGAYTVGIEMVTIGDFKADLEVSTGNAFASAKIEVDRE